MPADAETPETTADDPTAEAAPEATEPEAAEPEAAAPEATPEVPEPEATPEVPEPEATPEVPEPEATPEPEPDVAPFAALGASPKLVDRLAQDGIVEPTEIQALAIPPLMAGEDVIGQARTGTGKTAAFVVPLVERLDPSLKAVQAIVLAPTRELAVQVARVFKSLARARRGLRVVAIYGGAGYGPQLRALDRGAQVVVGTPGRVIDLIERGALRFDDLSAVVIDEADEMLQMGFIDEVERILDAIPPEQPRQVALFSATMPPPIRRIAKRHLKDPVDAKTEGAGQTVTAIDQQVVYAERDDLLMVLDRLLRVDPPDQALIFVATRDGSADMADALVELGHGAAAISGAMSQAQRTDVLDRFRSGALRLLVGTDVAARGLDVHGISHVFNIGPPHDLDSYVHRIGRTGRAGRTGIAITFASPRSRRRVERIEQHTGVRMTRRRWPSAAEARARRTAGLVARIADQTQNAAALEPYLVAVDALVAQGLDARLIAAAAARMADGDRPMVDDPRPDREAVPFALGGGSRHRVRPGDVVGTLCNEAGLHRRDIGYIDVDRFETVAWVSPAGAEVLAGLEVVHLRGHPVAVWPEGEPAPPKPARSDRGPRPERGRSGGDDRPRGGKRSGPWRRTGTSGSKRRSGGKPRRGRAQADRAGGGDGPFSGWKGRQGRRGRSTRHRHDED